MRARRRLRRWMRSLSSPRIQGALATFHSFFSKQHCLRAMKRARKKVRLVQRFLSYQNLLSRQHYIGLSEKRVFHLGSRIVAHKFIRFGKNKRKKRVQDFSVKSSLITRRRLPKRISIRFQRFTEAYYRGKKHSRGSAQLPYPFLDPNPRDHVRRFLPFFKSLLKNRFNRHKSNY